MARQARRLASPIDARLLVMGLVFLLAWSVIAVRLFSVQVVQAAEFSERALSQRLITQELAADRGTIFDRQGRALAVSIDATTIYANPQQITDPGMTARLLGGTLGLDIGELEADLSSDGSFVFVARQLEYELAQKVRDLSADFSLPGIHFVDEPKRVYPSGSLGAHVVGFVDVDSNGIEGLEAEYEDLLAGIPGQVLYEGDVNNRYIIPTGQYDEVPAVPGSDLVTTIDREVQFAAEQACVRAIDRTEAVRCTIVVMDPDTFEVLALVVSPTFDPGNRSSIDQTSGVLNNSAIRSQYEPGSTQKLVTVAAAIEEGIVEWDTEYLVPDQIELVEGACRSASDDILGCFQDASSHPDQIMTVKDCVTVSSNVCTIMIEQDLGQARLADYLDSFGYGAITGIDFPGEQSGNINLPAGCPTCGASAAIGYSVSVTPLQMATVYATVANDGIWQRPSLVSYLVDGAGQPQEIPGISREVVSAATARTMRLLLQSVVESGTGARAAIEGYSVGGKTGTTRRFVQGEGYTDDVVASFIGMAPIDDPKLVIAVVIDAPQVDASGGRAAAPVFAEVMEKALQQMGIGPYG